MRGLTLGLGISGPAQSAPSPLVITVQPTGGAYDGITPVTLSVTAQGGTLPYVYQWYEGTSGDTGTPLGGETNSTLDAAPETTTSYWCQVLDNVGKEGCQTADSDAATVTVAYPWKTWTEDYYSFGPAAIADLYQDTGATTPTTADGEAIKAAKVRDKAGNLWDTVTGNTAGWKYGSAAGAEAIGGKASMYFDGTEGTTPLRSSAKTFAQWAPTDFTFTMMIPLQQRGSGTDQKVIFAFGGNDPTGRFDTQNGGAIDVYGFMGGFLQRVEDMPDDDDLPHVFVLRCDGEAGKLYISWDDDATPSELDITALDGSAVLGLLGAWFGRVGQILWHPGDDANWLTHVGDVMAFYGIS